MPLGPDVLRARSGGRSWSRRGLRLRPRLGTLQQLLDRHGRDRGGCHDARVVGAPMLRLVVGPRPDEEDQHDRERHQRAAPVFEVKSRAVKTGGIAKPPHQLLQWIARAHGSEHLHRQPAERPGEVTAQHHQGAPVVMQPDHLHTARGPRRNAMRGSSDPLCAEHNPRTDSSLHAASCHACSFVSETSCECGNRYLDRALVIPTLQVTDAAFFAAI